MQISDLGIIITSAGVIGSLILNFVSLRSLRKSERQAREYSLNMADYEKRRDFILSNLSEYINILDAHELSFMAVTDEEYEGKDLEVYKKLYHIQTLYYKIKLMINPDNSYFDEVSKALDESLSLAKKIRSENSMAEFISNSLRTPERALEISKKTLEYMKNETKDSSNHTFKIDVEADNKAILDNVSEAVKQRDEHLKSYLSAATELDEKKEAIITVSRKYLADEKKQLLDKKGDNTQ